MATSIIPSIINLDRRDLYRFCDGLPAPVLARPVVNATLGRGLTLALDAAGERFVLTEDGKPCKFASIDDVMYELDGAPNVDATSLVVDLGNYWKRH